MEISKTKSKLCSVSIILVLAVSALATVIPIAIAQEVPMYAFLIVSPNPVGVNQQVSVSFFLGIVPPTSLGLGGDRWEDFELTITKPDGEVLVMGPYRSASDGGYYISYMPDQIGDYTFQFSFPGQTIDGVYYMPAESAERILTVQEEPIGTTPDYPLPTDYWERPVSAELREWYQISGNWLMAAYDTMVRAFDTGGAFNPYTYAPDSPHVVWTKELTFGGISDANFGYGANYYTGMSYEMKFTPPVIISGKLYYNVFPLGIFDPALSGVVCVDIRTGEEIWRKDDMPQITLAQVLKYDSPNQHGSVAYLWSTTTTSWKMYDAFTGTLLVTFENASTTLSGSTNAMFGPHGELLVYLLDGTNNRLAIWNSTLAVPSLGFGEGSTVWRPGYIPVVDWSSGIQLNRSIPDVQGTQTNTFASATEEVLLAEAVIVPEEGGLPTFIHVAYDAYTGDQLWVQERTNIGWGYAGPYRPGLLWSVAMGTQPREGIYVIFQKETTQWHAFSLADGQELWSTVPLSSLTGSDWSLYDFFGQIAYGTLYVAGYSGQVTAFDISDGSHLWTTPVISSEYDTVYGRWPFYGGITVADNKLYVSNGEHSPGTPMWKGEKLYCFDADTGDQLWSVTGWFIANSIVIADGYLVAYSGYDNRLYCFGMSKSSVSVTATPAVIGKGDTVLIQGTVLDQAPAQPDTACVSASSMAVQMEYLQMQKSIPDGTTITGVEVLLTAISEDGSSCVDIGTTMTEGYYGTFAFAWTPENEGTYEIVASFAADASYGSSAGATYVTVGPAAAAGGPIEPEHPVISIEVVIVIAVIAVLVIAGIAYLALRRRK